MTRKFSPRSLRNLRGIHPDLRKVIEAALQSSPYDFIVIEGVRSLQRQKELVASGASQTMRSRHLTGHAVDLLPIGPGGAAFDWPLYNQLGPHVKQVAEQLGVDLEWGGDWTSFKDGPHFQLSWSSYPPEDWVTGDEPPKPRTSMAQSTTMQAGALAGLSGAGGVATAVSQLDGTAQLIVIGAACVAALALLWICKERVRKWAEGDR